MSEENPKPLFTRGFTDLIIRARKLNEDRKIDGDLYFHPAESMGKVRVKTIDLNSRNPLCEVNSRVGNRRDWEERWLEAYLIQRAKKNDWTLSLAGKKYKFLASQFTFRKSPTLAVRGTQHRHVDLLLYDEEKKCLVALELKKESTETSLDEAKQELEAYVKELKRLVRDEEDALKEAFDLREVNGVVGYIVWPEYDGPVQELPPGIGLMQFRRPWKRFEDVQESGKKMRIEFTCPKRAEMNS